MIDLKLGNLYAPTPEPGYPWDAVAVASLFGYLALREAPPSPGLRRGIYAVVALAAAYGGFAYLRNEERLAEIERRLPQRAPLS